MRLSVLFILVWWFLAWGQSPATGPGALHVVGPFDNEQVCVGNMEVWKKAGPWHFAIGCWHGD